MSLLSTLVLALSACTEDRSTTLGEEVLNEESTDLNTGVTPASPTEEDVYEGNDEAALEPLGDTPPSERATSDDVNALADTPAASAALVLFDQGSAKLSPRARQELEAIARETKASETDKVEVKIVAWGDQVAEEPPSDGINPSPQLGDRRIQAISQFLHEVMPEELRSSAIQSFNMSSGEGSVGNSAVVRQSELESEFSRTGASPATIRALKAARDQGGPQKAIVVIGRLVD